MKASKDPFKLTSIDHEGHRINIIPAEVKGAFRRHRTIVQGILLAIFLLVPWIHFKGQQLILLDLSEREFIFFNVIFKSHDAPLLFLILGILTLGLAWVTAIWGRIWCGWACPQTVFIDAVYRRIEAFIEGNAFERRKLQNAPLSMTKAVKKIVKWISFAAVSCIFAHSFVAYFVGSRKLVQMMQGAPSENWTYFLLILFCTAVVTFDFGWFREQFCLIMCPYGRIQSVLLEPTSLTVLYDQKRGEPRRGSVAKEQLSGDCVNCNRCVEVCPTGIDIRNGLQMECIACTSCIDACDEIMDKLKKPKGLVGYRTLDDSPFQIWKVKTSFYAILILLCFSTLTYAISTRKPVDISVLRGPGAPFNEAIDSTGNPETINHFRIHLISQSDHEKSYSITLTDHDQKLGMILTVAQNPILLKAKSTDTWNVFLHFPRSALPKNGKKEFLLLIKGEDGFAFEQTLTFLGPAL